MLAAITAFSCSQKGTVEVTNRSGEALSGAIDGDHFTIGSGGTVSEEIDIGTKFIFGPDEKTITVTGGGLCVLPFSQRVSLKDEDIAVMDVYSDAGLITVENYTGGNLYVYLESAGQ
jgi:hypothetical protein